MLLEAATLQAKLEDAELKIAELKYTIGAIRDKVHAHNRGGELYAGLRDVIRDLCDQALATWADEPAPATRPIPHRSSA